MSTDRELFRLKSKGLGSLSDAEDAANKLQQRHVVHDTSGNSAATSAALTLPVLWTSHAIRIISATILPIEATSTGTTNATNYTTIALGWDDGAGGAITTIGSVATNATSLNLSASGQPLKVAMPLTATATEVAASKQLLLKTTKTGAGGEALGALLLDVCYQEI